MYVIEIIPIGRGMTADTLSYFSSTPYPRGTLLSIPLRSQDATGVVMDVSEVSAVKTALRAATFKLRKLPPQEPALRLSDETLATIDATAEYHASSQGAVLFSLLPKEIRNGVMPSLIRADAPTPSRETGRPVEIFQARTDERYMEYVSLVREAFASGSSVLLVVPTVEHGNQAAEALSGGIEKHTIILNSQRGIRAIRTAYTHLADETHPVLVIATPQYALIDRPDIRTVIIDYCRAHGYQGHSRPYVDYRRAVTLHGALLNRRVIMGDMLIRTEEEHLLRTGDAIVHTAHPRRLELPGRIKVVTITPDPDGSHAFSLYSPELLRRIRETLDAKERVFLYNARRGIAPVVACVDCGHIMRSPETGAPLSLHRRMKNGVEERWLICSVSGHRERARDICPSCGGWRLRERGIGIQHAYEELRPLFPETPIILFDNTTADTPKKASALRNDFYAHGNGILIGTALAIPYISKPVSLSAVISTDSLKAIPSWRQQEEALGVLLSLREKTNGAVVVQTRSEDDGLLEFAAKGSVQEFYDSEISLRETYNYPPMSTFIHIAWQGNALGVQTLGTMIEELFAPYNISIYGAPEHDGETKLKYGLIRVPSSEWPNPEIVAKLRTLPPAVRIIINPDRIV